MVMGLFWGPAGPGLLLLLLLLLPGLGSGLPFWPGPYGLPKITSATNVPLGDPLYSPLELLAIAEVNF